MVSEDRQKRLADNVTRLTAEILLTELKQPLPGVVTITSTQLARDLSRARVFYTFLGTEAERREVARRLGRVRTFVKREVGNRLHLRVTPDLSFQYDESAQKGAEVLRLLSELKQNERHSGDDTE